MFPLLDPDLRVGFFLGTSSFHEGPLIDPFSIRGVSCFDIDESGKMAEKKKRKKRTTAQKMLNAFWSGIGFVCMTALGLLVATSRYAWRLVRLLFQKIQTMRSPPGSATRSTANKPPVAKVGRRPQTPVAPLQKPARPQPTSQPVATLSGPGRWIGSNKSIVVHGITISGGLLYAGSTLKTAMGSEDPCLIDPTQPIAFRSSPVKIDGYWPSYAGIPPQARRTYLEWLASGRKDPNIDMGYVFLYFYGLERRAIFDAALDSSVMGDYPMLAAELTRLLSIYEHKSPSFKKYARQLLDWVTFTHEQKLYASTNLAKIEDSLMKIKFAMGQASIDAASVPSKLVLAWIKNDRTLFPLRTPATRCGPQFDAIFETRYREKFGSGLILIPNKTRLKFIYSPASSGFSQAADIAMSFKTIPDVTVSGKIAEAIKAIVEDATQSLEPFSRYLARNPQGTRDFEGLILLPPYLWPTTLRQTLHGLKRSVLKAPLAMTCLELMNTLGADSTLNKEKSKALGDALSVLGIGMEPDVCTTPKLPRPDETIVLFDLATTPDPNRETANYKACLLTVQLASAVAGADGEFSKDDFFHLNKQLQSWSHLPENHRARLSAQLRIRRTTPIKLQTIAKQLQALPHDSKTVIIAFMATLIQSGGGIKASEVRFMQKVHIALGIDANDYLAEHQSILNADNTKKKSVAKITIVSPEKPVFALDPLKIAALQSETSTVDALLQGIFSPEEDAQPMVSPRIESENINKPLVVRLDAARIAALQEDTDKVGSLLAGIFMDDERDESHDVTGEINTTPQEAGPVKTDEAAVLPVIMPGLDTTHDAFARCLLGRTQWSRQELQDVANDMKLMLDGALERLNDAAFDAYDAPFTEGDDPIEINLDIREKLSL